MKLLHAYREWQRRRKLVQVTTVTLKPTPWGVARIIKTDYKEIK